MLDPRRHHPPEIAMRKVGPYALRVAQWQALEETGAPPLLFFTGIGASIELLAPFLEQLTGRDVVAFDMPGVGGSPLPRWPYRLRSIARTADRLMRDLGHAGPIEVMGVSWGGFLAQQFAHQHGRRTRSLILAATSAGVTMVPGRLSALRHMIHPERHSDAGYMRRHMNEIYGGQTDGLPHFQSHSFPPTRRGYMFQLLAIWGWSSAWFLPFLKARVLILMGDDDRLVPVANGRFLRWLKRDATCETIPGAGHLFLLTHRDAMARRVESFLDEGRRTGHNSIQLRQ
jgi:poly(3-hydroxyalkanoate) depolymerase